MYNLNKNADNPLSITSLKLNDYQKYNMNYKKC